MSNNDVVKCCPICGQPVKENVGEEKAKVYHMVCLENAMRTVVIFDSSTPKKD